MAGRSLARLAGHVLADGGIVDPLHYRHLTGAGTDRYYPVPKSLEQAVVAPLRDFFGRNNARLILLLIVLYKLGTPSL